MVRQSHWSAYFAKPTLAGVGVVNRMLYLTHRIPFPPNKGDKIRSFNILQFLAKEYEVVLATLIDDPDDMKAIPQLRDQVSQILYSRIDRPGRKLFSLLGIFSGKSISVRHFYSNNLQEQIDELLDETHFDVILCSSSPTAEYLLRSRHRHGRLEKIFKIMDLIDVDSYKWQQYAERSSLVSASVYRYEADKLRSYELEVYDYFQKVLLVSEKEKSYFPKGDPQTKVHAVGNGVNLDYFDPTSHTPMENDHPTIVFTGMMDYWPNVEGMSWFVNDVFPQVKEELTDIRLIVVGGRPTRKVLGWESIDGVSVTGFVDDVREYIGMADVCIAPLRVARGIQNKVLEAMAMGKAVVATQSALEGIGLTLGVHAISADSAAEFSSELVALLKDSNRSKEIGIQARQFVIKNCSWSAKLGRLQELAFGSTNGPAE